MLLYSFKKYTKINFNIKKSNKAKKYRDKSNSNTNTPKNIKLKKCSGTPRMGFLLFFLLNFNFFF